VTLKEENASQKRTISAKESEISTLIGEREKFKEDLNFELSTHRDTKSRLELQTSLRESENKSSTRRISELEEDLKHEKNLADQVIGKLQKEIAEMKKDFENLRINNEENKKENKSLSKKLAKVNSELENANKEIDDNRIKIAIMNEEKEKLIKTALNAQSDQRKLKTIADRFDNKIENFVKLIYGELNFSTMLKDCTQIFTSKETRWCKCNQMAKEIFDS